MEEIQENEGEMNEGGRVEENEGGRIEVNKDKLFLLLNNNREINENQFEQFQRLLRMNSNLFEAEDPNKQSLLHLASANEQYFEIVKLLASKKPEMCLAHNPDGLNPLHVAAKRGNIKALGFMFKDNHLAARAKVESSEGGTILHICIKYNKLESLRFLLDYGFKDDEFVNAKDKEGNTILHLAVAGRKVKMLDYVLKHPKIRVNETNLNKQTAKGHSTSNEKEWKGIT